MSVRLTPQQLQVDPSSFVLDYRPGTDPANPVHYDVGAVTLGGVEQSAIAFGSLSQLVAYSFAGRCIVLDDEVECVEQADGPPVEAYTSRHGFFVVVLNGDGDLVFAEHTGAGPIYPNPSPQLREAHDVEYPRRWKDPRPEDERLPDASGSLS